MVVINCDASGADDLPVVKLITKRCMCVRRTSLKSHTRSL